MYTAGRRGRTALIFFADPRASCPKRPPHGVGVLGDCEPARRPMFRRHLHQTTPHRATIRNTSRCQAETLPQPLPERRRRPCRNNFRFLEMISKPVERAHKIVHHRHFRQFTPILEHVIAAEVVEPVLPRRSTRGRNHTKIRGHTQSRHSTNHRPIPSTIHIAAIGLVLTPDSMKETHYG